ncbi:conserved hypothetical protein [Leishmania infantum JPCM5]|uniref:Uncharacterized protein n=2 Tax=Leishmania infantum TaxID=5671 RepID=E9AGH1_LEIIN|nr:conserved hypothetical protein [Leishmania infantum JPCM5]CAC9463890.1 hypothetical_protein_-_conserved [Leishmania infantum]CBZ08471.1 conserved hypothetical protein [Leishmania infantum JPCM5]SUZ40023.1 hypothetical_protein_-_conserved [Leishmania infantum]|eukprot:XP_003392323.1 conserved hypothetical protein [Leishmania infantum JPCM5]
MHGGSATNEQEAAAPHPLLPHQGSTSVSSAGAVASSSGVSHLSCVEGGKRAVLATLWLDAERYTYEALCTAGAAAVTTHYVRFVEYGENNRDEEQHGIPHSIDMHAGDGRYNEGLPADCTATWDDLATDPRAQPLLRLVPHESVAVTRGRSSSSAPTSIVGAATDDTERRAGCGQGEQQAKANGCAVADDSTHRDSATEALADAHAAPSTSSGLLPLSSRDADVRLDILEEVELCNVAPILPRTFAVEQLVQQIVPCTHAFASQTPSPSIAESALSAEFACDGATSPSTAGPARRFSIPPLRTSMPGRCLARLRKVSDEHLAFLRAAKGSLVTTGVATSASAENGEAFTEEDSVLRARMALPCVPVYMQATSVATYEGSDNVCPTATHTGESSDSDPHEDNEQQSSEVGKGEVPTVPPVVGISQPLLSQLADFSSHSSAMEVALAHEAQARQTAVTISAVRSRSEELLLAGSDNAPTPREARESVSPISASLAGAMFAAKATAEASLHGALNDDITWPRQEHPARAPGSPTPSALPMSASMENVGSCLSEENIACSSFAAAQALYERYRQLLPQRCRAGAGFSTNSASAQESPTKLGGQSAPTDAAQYATAPCTAVLPRSTEDLEAAQEFWSTAAAASLEPSSMTTNTATNVAASATAATDTDADDADFLQWMTALSRQRCTQRLSIPLESSSQQGSRGQQQLAHQQLLRASQQRQGGAVVEWSSGAVSYTADTLGLYEEQQARSQRFYHVLPPPPLSPSLVSTVPGARPVNAAPVDGSISSVASTEDRSSLRGAVLAQLQRLSRLRSAECAVAHGAAVLEGEDTIEPLVLENRRPIAAAACLSPQPPVPVKGQPSLLSSNSSTSTPPTMSTVALSVRRCRCYRCLPLIVQFAQVPSLASPVLRRYLDVLHQTALPGLPAQQRHHGADATSAVEVGAVSLPEEAREPATQRVPSSMTDALAESGGPGETTVAGARSSSDRRHRRDTAHRNSRHRRYGAEDKVKTANGTKGSKRGREETTVATPTMPHSPQTGGDAQRPRVAADPLKVFPALQQWLMRRQEGGIPAQRASPNGKRSTTESGGAVLPLSDDIQQSGGAFLQPVAQTTTSHRHDTETCASCASGAALPPTLPSETLSGEVGSLGWVDDAVLDEVVVVGVVPRGHPHQLQLVAPSRAFCLTLTQRLEEVAEAAVHILGFLTPPHSALLSPLPAGMSRAPEAAAAATSASSSETTSDWRAWLETQYFVAMWTTLQRRLTTVEWQTVLQEARGSPFLARWTTVAAARSSAESAVFRGHPQRTGIELFVTRASEEGIAGSPAAEKHKVEATAHEVLQGVRESVCSAAELHTSACLSAAEDTVTRVVLTALVPILHRRITVMYELLRHFASKSLYMSHRMQCDAYQHWYSMTPSPAAVLRLLQRSGRFSRALARCYPQYDLSPVTLSGSTTLDDSDHAGAATRTAVPLMSFPSHPLSWTRDAAGTPTTACNVAARESGVTADLSSKHEEYSPQRDGFSASCATASPVRSQARVTAPAEVREMESSLSPSSSSSLTTTAAPIPAASAWVSFLPSWSDEASTQASSQQEQQPVMTYVPEAALLDPRYLQRFAWWMHRSHHSTGTNGSGSTMTISSNDTDGAGVRTQPLPRVASTVNIPGDYLRVLPMHEQDASIRIVLRSIAQKGRTLDLLEMSQHIHSHYTSYVYH